MAKVVNIKSPIRVYIDGVPYDGPDQIELGCRPPPMPVRPFHLRVDAVNRFAADALHPLRRNRTIE